MTRAPLPDGPRRRATAARDLLRHARRTLAGGGPFAPGHAVLQMRDAAAMLLRVAADHLGVETGDAGSLTEVADSIDGAGPAPLTHRQALDRLGGSAAAFVTAGEVPEDEDTRHLLHDLESFFTETVRGALESDPGRLGLRHLVGHRRSENWLARAEAALDDGEPAEAVRAAAAALAVFRWHLDRRDLYRGDWEREDRSAPEAAEGDLADLRRELQRQRADLDLLLAGADLSGYRRFRRLAPTVEIAEDGGLHSADDGAADPTPEDAAFSHDFVLETLLTLRRDNPPGPRAGAGRTDVVLRAVRATSILVTPSEEGEEIRRVSSGEVLKTHRTGEAQDGHIPIVVDGDPAWVAADAVEEIG